MYSEKEPQQDCEDVKHNSTGLLPSEHTTATNKSKKAIWRDDEEQEAMDEEVHMKKDCPPRFSTLFETKPVPVPIIQHMEEPQRRRERGMYLSWPAVILLGLILFFETVALFAYTAIGLYNNMPARLMTTGHTSTAAFDKTSEGQAPINIAPNFVIGSGDRTTVTETVTMYAPTPFVAQAFSTPAADTTGMAALASDLRGLLHSTTSSPSIPVVTITPGGGTATSVVLVTHTTDDTSSIARSTSFMTVFVAPSVLAAQQAASEQAVSASAAAVAAARSDSSSTSSTTASTTGSASTPSASTASSTESTTSSQSSAAATVSGSKGICFGGAGAVFQNCV